MTELEKRNLIRQAIAQAEKVRISCNIGITQPTDIIAVAVARGCEVIFASLPSLEGVYALSPKAVIFIGSERPAGRRRFTCAHELGHHEFKHGSKLDLFSEVSNEKTSEELMADNFASFVLMPKFAVEKAIRDRGFNPSSFSPLDIYKLSSFFGVGYKTIINHMAFSLGIIKRSSVEMLVKTSPKKIKEEFGGKPESEVVFIDEFWAGRAVDLEVGDIVVFENPVTFSDEEHLALYHYNNKGIVFKALRPGYLTVHSKTSSWSVNVRISRKNFEGFAPYRFIEEV